jgi:hypothetical protein
LKIRFCGVVVGGTESRRRGGVNAHGSDGIPPLDIVVHRTPPQLDMVVRTRPQASRLTALPYYLQLIHIITQGEFLLIFPCERLPFSAVTLLELALPAGPTVIDGGSYRLRGKGGLTNSAAYRNIPNSLVATRDTLDELSDRATPL